LKTVHPSGIRLNNGKLQFKLTNEDPTMHKASLLDSEVNNVKNC